MSAFEKIAKVRALALTARATIYNEDAMTALELAGVTACKVNECIEVVNALCDVVEEIHHDYTLQYNPSDESVTI